MLKLRINLKRVVFYSIVSIVIIGYLSSCSSNCEYGSPLTGVEIPFISGKDEHGVCEEEESTPKTGRFSAEGIAYSTSSGLSDLTTAGGDFEYFEADEVTFSIGDIELGKATGTAQITPLDLVEDRYLANRKVVNILRFLATLDEDGNGANGIQISENVRNAARSMSVNFDQAPSDFEVSTVNEVAVLTTQTAAGPSTLVGASAAIQQFVATVETIQTASGEEIVTLTRPPSDILLSGNRITNTQADSAIGMLSAMDEDTGDAHTFTLVSGEGDTDNASFRIEGTSLQIDTTALELGTQTTYRVRIQASDLTNLSFEKTFTIEVNTVNLEASATTLAETDGTITVSVTSAFAVAADVVIELATDGTAINNMDYSLDTTTLTIPSGETSTSAPITVTSISDAHDDDNETLELSINTITGAAIQGATSSVAATIVDDDELPAVTTLSPADNATNVGLNVDLVITMSETISGVSGKSITLQKASDDSVIATIDATDTTQISIADQVVTINPTADFPKDTELYVTIDEGAFVDSANDAYVGISTKTDWNFTTADVPVLTLVAGISETTNDATPSFTFQSTQTGTITYSGGCADSMITDVVTANADTVITYNTLADNLYNCTISVKNDLGFDSIAPLTLNFTVDTTPPSLSEVTAVTVLANDSTPDYTFSSDEVGSIAYSGSCSSGTTAATNGNNTFTFNTLADNTYNDCTITVTDAVNNASTPLTVSSFTIDTTAPTLSEVTAIATPDLDSTPDYTFSSDEAGSITYGGVCNSSTIAAINGNNTVTFDTLADNTYSDCTVKVTDAASNASTPLSISTFIVHQGIMGSFEPSDDSVDFAVDSNLVWSFAEIASGLTPVSGKSITIQQVSDDSVVFTSDVTNAPRVSVQNGFRVEIDPEADLSTETELYVTIDYGAFLDENGFPTAGITTKGDWSFTTETGIGWEYVGNAGFSAAEATASGFVVNNGTPYVSFADSENDSKITVMAYNGTTWEIVGTAGFSHAAAQSPQLQILDGNPYVLYRDNTNFELTAMRFNGTSWELVGSVEFTPGRAAQQSFYIDNGTPYASFQDSNDGNKLTVMKFNGTDWETVGAAGITGSQVYTTSLAFDNNTPYVGFRDLIQEHKATVMTFNGTSWEAVGTEGFTSGRAFSTKLVIDNGTLYLGYDDADATKQATVMKYNGTNWEVVGTAEFSTGGISEPSLVVHNGTPYFAYVDSTQSSKATVMSYNGTQWEPLGGAGFTSAGIATPTLKISNNVLYIAFKDTANSNKVSVMKYTGTLP